MICNPKHIAATPLCLVRDGIRFIINLNMSKEKEEEVVQEIVKVFTANM